MILSLAMLFSVFPAMTAFGAEEEVGENNLAVAMSEGGRCSVVQGEGHAESAESFEIKLEEGKEVTLKFSANESYYIETVVVNDEKQSLDSESTEYTYKYTPSSSPVAVNVVFSKLDSGNIDSQDKPAADDNKGSVVVKDDKDLSEKIFKVEDELRDATPEELAHPSKYVGEPGRDGYKFTLTRPESSYYEGGGISTANVKTGSVTVEVPTSHPVYNYCPLPGNANIKIALKDIWDDYYNNKDFNWNGNQWCRMVYCLDWHKGSPSGGNWAGGTPLGKEIQYCLTYGVQYWGHTAYSKYSSGDWIMDYCITQLAIHACNGEFGSISKSYSYIYDHINNATVKDRFNRLMKDALDSSQYDSFGYDAGNTVYNSFTYKVAPSTQSKWSYYVNNNRAGYITSDYYSQNISDDKWLKNSMPWYITGSGCTVSGVSGAEIVWEESKNYSRFRIWIPEANYRAAQATGATLTAHLTCQSPNGLCGWRYNPSDSVKQPFTFLEQYKLIGRSVYVTATIDRVVQDGTLTITKVSGNTSLVKDNNNYTLKNATFKVYNTGTNTLVKTLTTDANGKTSCTLSAGTYDVEEVTAPSGYIKDGNRRKVTVTSGGNASVSITNNPIYGIINLSKSSSKPEYTDGNAMYSLEGAVYGVYRQGTNAKVCEIKTGKDGKGSSAKLPIGTYNVKEITAPKGYVLDSTIHQVTVSSSSSTEEVKISLAVTDKPYLDPITVILKKVDAVTGKPKPVGAATLSGAEYEVKYFSSVSKSNPEESGERYVRKWVFKTDKDGYIDIGDKSYFVSGDDFYISDSGVITFPVGTVTVKEISSPSGYLLDPKTYTVPITLDSATQRITSYAIPTSPENSLDFRLDKRDWNTDGSISGAVFRHTSPDGSTEEATTDEKGELTFRGLTWGSHTVEEISAPDGYILNTNKITFDVAEDNTITITSEPMQEDVGGHDVEVADDGCIDAIVYDKPIPYKVKVHKTNNKNFVLAGAEFTLYDNMACTRELDKAVTDSKGELTFSNLIPEKNYWVKETKAPTGYHLPDEDIVFYIKAQSVPSDSDDFSCTVCYGKNAYHPPIAPCSISAGESGNVYVKKDSTGSFYITGDKKNGYTLNIDVVNQIGNKLPNTGSSWSIILLISGVALILAGYFSSKRRSSVTR